MAFRVTGILSLDGTPFHQSLTRADIAVRRFSSGMVSRFAALFSVGAIGYAIKRTVEYAGTLTDLAARTGVSIEALQRFDRWARDNGATLETLIGIWERLSVARARALGGSATAQAAFGAFGIGTGDLRTMTADQLTQRMAQAFSKATNIEPLIAPLREIGGRGAMQLAAAFRQGFGEEYQNIAVMSAEQADMLDELSDKWDSLGQLLMVDVANALVWVINKLKQFVQDVKLSGVVLWQTGEGIKGGFKGLAQWFTSGEYLRTGAIRGMQRFFGGFHAGYVGAEAAGGDETAAALLRDFASQDAWEKARRAARIRSRARTTPPIFEDVATTSRLIPMQADALVKVGNFLGTNRNIMEAIANRQTTLLVRIEANTRKIAERTEESNPEGVE